MKYLILIAILLTGCTQLDQFLQDDNADAVISAAVVSKTAGSAINVYQAYLIEAGREDLLQASQSRLQAMLARKEAAENMTPEAILLMLAKRGEMLTQIEQDYSALYDYAVIAETESGVAMPYKLVSFHGEVINLYEKLKSGDIVDGSVRADLYLEFAAKIAMVLI